MPENAVAMAPEGTEISVEFIPSGGTVTTIALPAGPRTAADVLAAAGAVLGPGARIYVNNQEVSADAPVADGDVVARLGNKTAGA